MNSTNLASLFTFPEADLAIVVTYKGDRIVGGVSSKALCLASVVFEKLVNPPFGRFLPARRNLPLEARSTEQRKCVDTNCCMGFEKCDLDISKLTTETSEERQFLEYDMIENECTNNHTTPSPKSDAGSVLQPKDDGELDFQEDNAESLRLLLQIVHLQFNKIPSKLLFETLLGMSHLCEIYQCVHLVLPWLDGWLADGLQECRVAGKEEYLFIAWAFGRATLFSDCANHITNQVYLVDGIPAINQGYSRYLDEIEGIPPKTIERILEARQAKLQRLLDIPYKVAQDIISSRPVNKCLANEKNCDSITYGSLILALSDMELWPEKRADEVDTSIRRISTQLACLDVQVLPDSNYKTHKACKFDIAKAAVRLYSEKVDCTLDSHIHHIKAQTKKLARPRDLDQFIVLLSKP